MTRPRFRLGVTGPGFRLGVTRPGFRLAPLTGPRRSAPLALAPRSLGFAPLALALLAGLTFGAGLLVSGMTDPSRVLAFLDITGAWDPRLALVLGGAVLVHAIAHHRMRARPPWFDTALHLPSRHTIDPRLLLGAALFGIGWGLVGLCPGPALVAAGAASPGALLFLAALLAGSHLARP